MVEHFKKFEDSLEKKQEEDISLKDGKMASRLVYLKKLINKRKGLISNQMDKIKNENQVAQFNSQQKADYLRCVDNTKLGKSLAKRALNTGDLNTLIAKEIDEISKCIDELNDIDYSTHPSSFYSTCTTVESLKDIRNLVNEPIYDELEVSEVLKLINIVGIACNGKVGEYPDPSVYLVKNIYPGCYISMADIATAEEYSKGNEHLEVPGTKEEINNCIPIFPNEKVYNFLKKCPKILELFAGLGMRRVIADIPLTFESLVLSGLWKMIGLLKGKKSEINIKCFIDICNSMKYICGDKYNDVIDIIKEQLKNKDIMKKGLYLNNYGLFPMLPVLYNCAKNKTFNKEELHKIYRAILRFEVYKIIFLGDQNTGKSCILNRFVEDKFDDKYQATIGLDFQSKNVQIDNQDIHLLLYDTAGQEKFRSLIPMYTRDANIIILVYDISNRDSFSNLSHWLKDLTNVNMEEVILCVVGNKIDLNDKRVVNKEEGEKFAEERGFIFQEISAKTGDGFSDLFYKNLFEQIRIKFRPSGQQPASEINDIKFNIDQDENKSTPKKKCC